MLKQRSQKLYRTWMKKRLPAASTVVLNHRRLFIIPSRQGVYFLLVIALVFIAAANYQNNFVFALAMLFFSIFNTAIVMTYLNLTSLTIQAGQCKPVFAGQLAQVQLYLKSQQKPHFGVSLGFDKQLLSNVDVLQGQSVSQCIAYQTATRGEVELPRFLLQSQYPLGFLQCWSWVSLQQHLVVYPEPKTLSQSLAGHQVAGDGSTQQVIGSDDFEGFRAYQSGDAIRDIHWPSLAKEQPIMSKSRVQHVDEAQWVDWYALDAYGLSLEQRLSVMCDWVLKLHESQRHYGLRLPAKEISPNHSEQHRHNVLYALSVYS